MTPGCPLRLSLGHDTRRRSASSARFGSYAAAVETLLDGVVPGFLHEGKRYLTIAIGCTGGRHRSVVVAEELAEYFRRRSYPVAVEHRDLGRE